MDHPRIISTARRQHGLVTRRQALELGGTDQRIRALVDGGKWERTRRGVFVVGAAPDIWERQVMAACLAAGPGVVASHRTAARLWEMVERSGRIQLLAGDARQIRLAGIEVHRSALLPAVDTTSVRGIPVSTTARTITDLSATQGSDTIGAWIDRCLRSHQLHLLELRSCVARLAGPGRGDLAGLRALLAKRLPGYDPGDSDLEVRALTILHAAGLPSPVQQHQVRRPNGRWAYLDLAYPEHQIGIELDGWEFHSQRGAFDKDRDRRNDLTLLGWRIYQFTSTTTDRSLVATIRRALEADCGH